MIFLEQMGQFLLNTLLLPLFWIHELAQSSHRHKCMLRTHTQGHEHKNKERAVSTM